MTADVRTFLASFLVLFLEVALIRWMPAYIRLLAYFSNFILLASFLGIGVGCLLAARSRGRSILELALGWLLSQPGVASVIAGATSREQVQLNAAASTWTRGTSTTCA